MRARPIYLADRTPVRRAACKIVLSIPACWAYNFLDSSVCCLLPAWCCASYRSCGYRVKMRPIFFAREQCLRIGQGRQTSLSKTNVKLGAPRQVLRSEERILVFPLLFSVSVPLLSYYLIHCIGSYRTHRINDMGIGYLTSRLRRSVPIIQTRFLDGHSLPEKQL